MGEVWARVRVAVLVVALVTVSALDMPSQADETVAVEVRGSAVARPEYSAVRPGSATTSTTTSTTSSTTTTRPNPTTRPPTTTEPAVVALAEPTVEGVREVVLPVEDRALALVEFDWRAAFPDWEIVFLGERSGIRALTYPNEKRIEVFVRESESAESLHRVIAHELGHVVDVELNESNERDRWLEQRGIDESVPWWPDESAPDFGTGAGDFAEAFAVWETGVRSQSVVAGQPSAADLSLLAELVAAD